MKNLKMSVALLAAALGLTASFAFNTPAVAKNNNIAVSWFLYNGNGVNNPNNYNKISGTPACNGDGALCAIRGEEDGTTGHPMASVLTDASTQRLKFD